MTSPLIMDFLVYLYILLEHLLFVYYEELKIRSHAQYIGRFKEKDRTILEEPVICSPELIPGANPISIIKPVDVALSELDEAAEALFAELQQELGKVEKQGETRNMMDDELEDCIQMSDLESEKESLLTGYESFASSRIADFIDGPQQWVVTVVGMEESYIHISDGRRIWVNVGEKVYKLRNGDVLILDVIRKNKEVLVENIFRIETDVLEEYVIPDEVNFYQNERKMVI